MTPERFLDINLQSVMALYMGGLAFQTFAIMWMNFPQNPSFNTWTPPTRQRYTDDLLDKCYEIVKVKVEKPLEIVW
jgi:hypothetical protein